MDHSTLTRLLDGGVQIFFKVFFHPPKLEEMIPKLGTDRFSHHQLGVVIECHRCTLSETISPPLKIDRPGPSGPQRGTIAFQPSICRCYACFRKGSMILTNMLHLQDVSQLQNAMQAFLDSFQIARSPEILLVVKSGPCKSTMVDMFDVGATF